MANFGQELEFNPWTSTFTLTDATRFGSSTTAPAYIGRYGTFRGDSAGNTSGLDQSARLNGFTGVSRTTAYASFAFRVRRIQLSGGAPGVEGNGNPGTLNTHRDFLCWSKCKQSNDSTQVTDGGTPSGAPFKLSIIKTTDFPNSGAVFLNFGSTNISVLRDPVNGFGFDGYLGHWMGLEWQLTILRWLNNAQNGFFCTARMWNLESRNPRPIITMAIGAPPGDSIFTSAFFTDDVVLGANKIRTTGAAGDDEIDIDYDEFRGGKGPAGFPRKLWGGDFRQQVVIDKFDPVGAVQDFSRRYILPSQNIQDLTCNYREHFLETDASVRVVDPGVYRIETGATVAGGGQTPTTFATDFTWATAPNYLRDAKRGNLWCTFLSGNVVGQTRRVTFLNNSNFYMVCEPGFTATPNVGSAFRVEHRSSITKDFLSAPKADNEYRLEVIGTDHSFRAPIVDLVAGWDELGPVWWSGFLDTIEADDSPSRKGVRLRAFGVSDFLTRSRSVYKVSKKGESLDIFETMKNQFENFDKCIDLQSEQVDSAGVGVRLPFEAYGEEAAQVMEAVTRILGNFVVGIETAPFHHYTGDLSTNADYRFRIYEQRDDRDDTVGKSTGYLVRTIPHLSPRLRELTIVKNHEQFANKWKFEGAAFQNEILTIVTHRGRREDPTFPAGFSSLPFLDVTEFEQLSQGSPTTGSEQYPASFVGWQVELIDLVSRVAFTSEETGETVFEGGPKNMKNDLFGRRIRTIYEWLTQATKSDFRTTKNFPGAVNGYASVNTTNEALIVKMTPNGRPVERILGNSKTLATLGARLKIIQSTDVIGWLQAGMAAQVDQFASVRRRYSARVVEYPMRERPDPTNNRIAIATPETAIIKYGTTGAGGDGLKVGARNPASGTSFATRQKYQVGNGKIGNVRSLSLRLQPGGWVAEWSIASTPMTAQDVLSRFARTNTKVAGR